MNNNFLFRFSNRSNVVEVDTPSRKFYMDVSSLFRNGNRYNDNFAYSFTSTSIENHFAIREL